LKYLNAVRQLVRIPVSKMGHDARVSLKHYAQTTDNHFDRATGGAESGAQGGKNESSG